MTCSPTAWSTRARDLLRTHETEVHRLAARLIECRHMDGDAFERLMDGTERDGRPQG
jgi:ATP-dependent Zn protease